MTFRPYQEQYINSIVLNKSNLIISPMRSGKSLIIKGIIDKYNSFKKVLILVGIRHVILQLAEYYKNSEYTFILSGESFDTTKRIHLGTFQTLQRRDINLTDYDLICVDEAHMRFNTRIVKEIRDTTCTRIFFTGTPLKQNNTFLSNEFDNILEFINIPEMISKGYLAKTHFRILGNMLSDEKSMTIKQGDYLNSDIDRIINKTDLINMLLVDNKKYKWSNMHKTIMYTNSIKTTEQIVNKFNSSDVRGIHSKLSTKQLKETLDWFNTTNSGIIVNCRMLAVGVDIPSADTVVYLLPTKIHSLFLQSIFRASTKYKDKEAIVYDYSGMLNKVNPFSNEWKKSKLSCRDQCLKQYADDPMELYFCMEGCKGEPILVTCNGKQPASHIDNPYISDFQVHSGEPCGEAHPSWEYTFKQTDNGIGSVTKWAKCPCGCITKYNVQTLHKPSDMIAVYDDSTPSNTVTIIYSAEHHKALALFDDISKSRYKILMFDSSEELYIQACKFFKQKQFQIVANRKMSKLPNVAVDRSLDDAIPLISWESNNAGFIKKLIKLKLTQLINYFGIKPGMVYYISKKITKDNEKSILSKLGNTAFDRNQFIKYCKQLQNSIKD